MTAGILNRVFFLTFFFNVLHQPSVILWCQEHFREVQGAADVFFFSSQPAAQKSTDDASPISAAFFGRIFIAATPLHFTVMIPHPTADVYRYERAGHWRLLLWQCNGNKRLQEKGSVLYTLFSDFNGGPG